MNTFIVSPTLSIVDAETLAAMLLSRVTSATWDPSLSAWAAASMKFLALMLLLSSWVGEANPAATAREPRVTLAAARPL